MTCTPLAGNSSTRSSTVVLHRFAGGKVAGEARSPHPLKRPPSEQNSAFWRDALVDARKRRQSNPDQVAAITSAASGHRLVLLDQNYTAKVTDCSSRLLGVTWQKFDLLAKEGYETTDGLALPMTSHGQRDLGNLLLILPQYHLDFYVRGEMRRPALGC
jgi:hypothetical protein